MASNSLSGTGVSPAGTKAQLLHIGVGTLGAGAVVRLGDGTATPLTISSSGISVTGTIAATSITLSSSLTAASASLSGNLSVGGTASVTGTLSVTGVLIFSGIQELSGAGAVDPTKPTTLYTSTGASQALSLADGTNGQMKTICHVVDGGSGVLTPTTKTGFSTITFTAAGDSATLQFFTTRGWIILAVRGASVS